MDCRSRNQLLLRLEQPRTQPFQGPSLESPTPSKSKLQSTKYQLLPNMLNLLTVRKRRMKQTKQPTKTSSTRGMAARFTWCRSIWTVLRGTSSDIPASMPT